MIRWRQWRKEHEDVVLELQQREREIVEQTRRLIRLEAEVGIYRPLFPTDDEQL